ncbi:MAG: ion transporter [Synechococcales bacterium]|nr:ion transporter [Synechococcales bacterium]
MPLRQQIAFYLEDIETPIGRGLNLFIMGLILVSSIIFVAESYAIPQPLQPWLDGIEIVILGLFGLEYLLRFWCAEDKLKFVFSVYSIIDIAVLLPFLLGAVNVGFFRIFRWFRILRLIRFFSGKTLLGYVSSEDVAIVTRILFTIFSIIFVYSGLIYQAEHAINPNHFTTFLDAVYFSVSAVTTAGFGDIVPISQTGRLLAVMMLLSGVILVPWQFGDLIRRLLKTADQIQIVCTQCGWAIHDTNAHFCKICGHPLPKPNAIDPP